MRKRALLIIAAATIVTAGCGNSEPAIPVSQAGTAGSSSSSAAGGPDLSKADFTDLTTKDTASVQARDNSFVEPYITVKAGTEVDFTNKGRNQHDVEPTVDGAFAGIPVEDFQPGGSGKVTFTVPGDYPYYCTLHGTKTKGMVGAVRVLQ